MHDAAAHRDVLVQIIIREADELGLTLIRLRTEAEPRLGVVHGPTTEATLRELNARLSSSLISIRKRKFVPKENVYEFAGATPTLPEEALYFEYWPRAHCSAGKQYLQRHTVTIEPILEMEEFYVVLRNGLGPRRLPLDQRPIENVTDLLPETEIGFPIDLVYTWVDSRDPAWREQFDAFISSGQQDAALPMHSTNEERWRSRDELKYSLRSAWMYAPFVRNIFVITNGQKPEWLVDGQGVYVVDHGHIFENDEHALPTFNSHAIESTLQNIDGLSEHYLYLNDDFFFGAPVTARTFFTTGGNTKHFRSNRYLDLLPARERSSATVAAHKRTRDVLRDRLGINAEFKFKHAPYALRRSVQRELEFTFRDEFSATRRAQVRSFDDITPVSFMYEHFALANGSGCLADITYAYIDLGVPGLTQRLDEVETQGPAVFCLNESGVQEGGATEAAVTDLVVEFLENRFPVVPPWEDPEWSYVHDGREFQVSPTEIAVATSELDALGFDALLTLLETRRSTSADERVARKVAHLLSLVARYEEAASIAVRSSLPDFEKGRLALKYLSYVPAISTRELLAEESVRALPTSEAGLRHVVRSVTAAADLEAVESYLSRMAPELRDSPPVQRSIASAWRRADRPTRALAHLLRCVELVVEVDAHPSTPRIAPRLLDPWAAWDDLASLARSVDVQMFADAGTLLGFVRDGDFIPHDYDIDVGVRSLVELDSLRRVCDNDWRFQVLRGRMPDLLFQVRHHSGASIDVMLHRQTDDGRWVKRSHVYGWTFEDSELVELDVRGRPVGVPARAERYLEEMYGQGWKTPDPSFDSRLEAPNLFFPDRDELACTLVAKLAESLEAGDVQSALKFKRYLDRSATPIIPASLDAVLRERLGGD